MTARTSPATRATSAWPHSGGADARAGASGASYTLLNGDRIAWDNAA